MRLHRLAIEDIFELFEVTDVARLPGRPVAAADRDEVRHAGRGPLVPAVDAVLAQRRLGLDRIGREAARTEPDLVGLGARNEVARRVQVFSARRQDQVLAALPLVGTGLAHVDDGPLPDVIHAPGGRARGNFDHERPLRREVPEGEGVDRGEVRRQHARLVLQGLVHHHLAVARAEVLALRFAQAIETHRRQTPEEGLRRALEIHLVVKLLDRLARGVAVLELHRAETGIDRLRARHRRAEAGDRQGGDPHAREGTSSGGDDHGHGLYLMIEEDGDNSARDAYEQCREIEPWREPHLGGMLMHKMHSKHAKTGAK